MIPSFLTLSSDFAIFVLCIFNVQTTSNDYIYIYICFFIYTYTSKSPLKKNKKVPKIRPRFFSKYPRLGAGSGEWVSDPSERRLGEIKLVAVFLIRLKG